MEIYTEIQTFKLDKEMKIFLNDLKKNKVNVSKFIREAIQEKLDREKLIKKDKIRKQKKKTKASRLFDDSNAHLI